MLKKGEAPKALKREERLAIMDAWVNSGGALSFRKLSEMFGRDERTVAKVIQKGGVNERAKITGMVLKGMSLDWKLLEKQAQLNLIKRLYGDKGNDFQDDWQVTKMVLTGELKKKMKETSEGGKEEREEGEISEPF